MRSSRLFILATFVGVLAPGIIGAQAAHPLEGVEPPHHLKASLRQAIEGVALGYPLVGFRFFGRDSAQLVFEDSSYTAAAVNAGKWMFGPDATVAEADGCPPEKVLGRKIARVLWHSLGKPQDLQYITIAVRGSTGLDRWSHTTMYYYRDQLDGPWVGDSMRD